MKLRPRLNRDHDACGRQGFRVGCDGATVGTVWYSCPKCRQELGVLHPAPWMFEVYDDSDPVVIKRSVGGFRRSKSAALRAVRREFERRSA